MSLKKLPLLQHTKVSALKFSAISRLLSTVFLGGLITIGQLGRPCLALTAYETISKTVPSAVAQDFSARTPGDQGYSFKALLLLAENKERQSQEEEETRTFFIEREQLLNSEPNGKCLKPQSEARFFSLAIPLYIRYHSWKTPDC
jgi:hypothetical protein